LIAGILISPLLLFLWLKTEGRFSREPTGSQEAEGTQGKVVDGLDVTDSLPIPRLRGVFDAIENITFGALSVRERPFHSAKPNTAGVPTS